MKRSLIRLFSLALCMVMVLGLAACGSSSQSQSASQPQSSPSGQSNAEAAPTASTEYVWKSEFLSVKSEDDTYIQPVLFQDDGFYASGQIKIGRQEVPEGEV